MEASGLQPRKAVACGRCCLETRMWVLHDMYVSHFAPSRSGIFSLWPLKAWPHDTVLALRRASVVVSSSRPVLATSRRRVVASSRRRADAPSRRRVVLSSCVTSSRLRVVASSRPLVVAPSLRRVIASSRRCDDAQSRRRVLASSRRRVLALRRRRGVAKPSWSAVAHPVAPKYRCMRNGINYFHALRVISLPCLPSSLPL